MCLGDNWTQNPVTALFEMDGSFHKKEKSFNQSATCLVIPLKSLMFFQLNCNVTTENLNLRSPGPGLTVLHAYLWIIHVWAPVKKKKKKRVKRTLKCLMETVNKITSYLPDENVTILYKSKMCDLQIFGTKQKPQFEI